MLLLAAAAAAAAVWWQAAAATSGASAPAPAPRAAFPPPVLLLVLAPAAAAAPHSGGTHVFTGSTVASTACAGSGGGAAFPAGSASTGAGGGPAFPGTAGGAGGGILTGGPGGPAGGAGGGPGEAVSLMPVILARQAHVRYALNSEGPGGLHQVHSAQLTQLGHIQFLRPFFDLYQPAKRKHHVCPPSNVSQDVAVASQWLQFALMEFMCHTARRLRRGRNGWKRLSQNGYGNHNTYT